MHFEILVEDQSGKIALEILIPKIIDPEKHTYRINPYKGIGHLPKNLNKKSDSQKRILLQQLPRLIRGYGNTLSNYPPDYPAVLIVICDLDDRCLKNFRQELLECLDQCDSKPETYFCIAIEEGEAWYLGDKSAIEKAYPRAKMQRLKTYKNDSICGTWEQLAKAVLEGGYKTLANMTYQEIGKEKSNWAKNITPYMNIEQNQSPSFCYFRDKLRSLST